MVVHMHIMIPPGRGPAPRDASAIPPPNCQQPIAAAASCAVVATKGPTVDAVSIIISAPGASRRNVRRKRAHGYETANATRQLRLPRPHHMPKLPHMPPPTI